MDGKRFSTSGRLGDSQVARPIRLAVFTLDLPEANAITQRVLAAFRPQVTGLIRSRSIRQGQRTWEALKYLYGRSGPLLVAKALESALCPIASQIPRLTGRVPRTAPLRRIAKIHGQTICSTANINAPHMRQIVAGWQPDLLVSIYMNQRFERELLDLAPLGAINVHPSLLPQHRGLLPYIWAMADGDRQTGVTVHWMDESLDTGEIIQQRSTPIHLGESAVSLAHRCADIAAEMMVEAIRSVQRGMAARSPQEPRQGSYHSWPDRDCLLKCREQGHGYFSVADMWRELSRAA